MKRYCFEEPPREGCFEFEDLRWRSSPRWTAMEILRHWRGNASWLLLAVDMLRHPIRYARYWREARRSAFTRQFTEELFRALVEKIRRT